jgi:hypothetical protein
MATFMVVFLVLRRRESVCGEASSFGRWFVEERGLGSDDCGEDVCTAEGKASKALLGGLQFWLGRGNLPNTSADGDNFLLRFNEGEAEKDSLILLLTYDKILGRKLYNSR